MVVISTNYGPRGALITGCVGFVFFYFAVPWLLVLWADHNKAQMSNGVVGAAMKQLLDGIFIRRFIQPSEWAAIAILVGCLLVALWKAFTRTDLDYQNQRDITWFAEILARLFD